MGDLWTWNRKSKSSRIFDYLSDFEPWRSEQLEFGVLASLYAGHPGGELKY